MIELIENNLPLLILTTCLVIFFIWLGWKIRLWWKNFLFMLLHKKGRTGERSSIKVLEKNGYKIIDKQIPMIHPRKGVQHATFWQYWFLNRNSLK